MISIIIWPSQCEQFDQNSMKYYRPVLLMHTDALYCKQNTTESNLAEYGENTTLWFRKQDDGLVEDTINVIYDINRLREKNVHLDKFLRDSIDD